MKNLEIFKDLYGIEFPGILSTEQRLGSFSLRITPGPMDGNIYVYKVGELTGKPSIDREDALLEFLIDNADLFKYRVNQNLLV